jgi:hypothetical protein
MMMNLNASLGIIDISIWRCLMPQVFIDLLGKKFGKLLVIEKIKVKAAKFNKRASSGVRWKCLCDCGNECIAYGGHLRIGTRRSCGCAHEVNIEKTGCKILYRNLQRKCEKRKREFNLSLDEFSVLIKQNCYYCNTPPSQVIKRSKSKKLQIIYNGIDRINSNIGYTIENCVTCCKWCNQSKSNLDLLDWKSHLLKIVNHLGIS